jgi:hypothetical protein
MCSQNKVPKTKICKYSLIICSYAGEALMDYPYSTAAEGDSAVSAKTRAWIWRLHG